MFVRSDTAARAYVYARPQGFEYEASASILIKDEKKGVDDSKVVEQFNIFGSKKIVENEIEMIRSRTLLEMLLKNFVFMLLYPKKVR